MKELEHILQGHPFFADFPAEQSGWWQAVRATTASMPGNTCFAKAKPRTSFS